MRACSNPSMLSLKLARVGFLMAPSSRRRAGSEAPICSIMQIRSFTPMLSPSASSIKDKSSSRNSMMVWPSRCRASKNCFRRKCIGFVSRKTVSRMRKHVRSPGTWGKNGRCCRGFSIDTCPQDVVKAVVEKCLLLNTWECIEPSCVEVRAELLPPAAVRGHRSVVHELFRLQFIGKSFWSGTCCNLLSGLRSIDLGRGMSIICLLYTSPSPRDS